MDGVLQNLLRSVDWLVTQEPMEASCGAHRFLNRSQASSDSGIVYNYLIIDKELLGWVMARCPALGLAGCRSCAPYSAVVV